MFGWMTGFILKLICSEKLLSQLELLTFSDDRAFAALAIVTPIANEIVQIGSNHRPQWPIAIPVPGAAMVSMF